MDQLNLTEQENRVVVRGKLPQSELDFSGVDFPQKGEKNLDFERFFWKIRRMVV